MPNVRGAWLLALSLALFVSQCAGSKVIDLTTANFEEIIAEGTVSSPPPLYPLLCGSSLKFNAKYLNIRLYAVDYQILCAMVSQTVACTVYLYDNTINWRN